jgi:glycosyltransferase involved in cell wall biosynthesis
MTLAAREVARLQGSDAGAIADRPKRSLCIGLLTLLNPWGGTTVQWGGTEVHTLRFARTLAERGHVVTIVCLTPETYEAYRPRVDESVALVSSPRPRPGPLSFARWLRALPRWDVCILAKGVFDVGDADLDLAARTRCRTYLTVEHLPGAPTEAKESRRHFGVVPGLGLWWYRERLRRFSRSLGPQKIVCVSDAVGRRLVGDYRFPARKVVTVRNGIDVERFRPDGATAAEWRRRWGIPPDALIVGAVGRLALMKGYDIALAAFQTLLMRSPQRDVRFVLVGEGNYERQLRELAQAIVPGGRVTFSPFYDRPWEPLGALDVFVMPSRNEGLPLALLEAMACGCCSVASDVGGIPEVLSRPGLGWMVPAEDVDAFTAALIEAADRTPEQRAIMGALARQHVVRHFSAAVQFNALADVVESLARPPIARELRAAGPSRE